MFFLTLYLFIYPEPNATWYIPSCCSYNIWAYIHALDERILKVTAIIIDLAPRDSLIAFGGDILICIFFMYLLS